MVSQHCANCIGTLSFTVLARLAVVTNTQTDHATPPVAT